MKFGEFGTKAGTLQQLYGRLNSAKVLPLVITSLDELATSQAAILARIAELKSERLIVRSSSRSEDTASTSNARSIPKPSQYPCKRHQSPARSLKASGGFYARI